MNKKDKISKEEYLESLHDALDSIKAVLENNLMQKTTADLLKAIEITYNITKEVYWLSQEKEGAKMKVNEPYIYFEIFHLDKENSKYEIETIENGSFVLLEIEPPCNDRRLLAQGDSISELVQWAIENE